MAGHGGRCNVSLATLIALLIICVNKIDDANGLQAGATTLSSRNRNATLKRGVEELQLARSVRDCYNAPYHATPYTFEEFLAGEPTRLYVHRVYWSRKGEALPLTLYTAASMSRLKDLETQCREYPGPYAAAIHLPLHQPSSPTAPAPTSASSTAFSGTQKQQQQQRAELQRHPALSLENTGKLQHAARQLQELFDRLEAQPSACQLRLLLLVEVVASRALLHLPPTAALRNAAALMCRTAVTLTVDVDLAVGVMLTDIARHPGRSNEWNVRCHDKGRVLYVVPALDAYPDGEAAPPPGGSFEEWQQRQWLLAEVVAKVTYDRKRNLATWLHDGVIGAMSARDRPRAQNATDMAKWVEAYRFEEVKYVAGYEPYVIASRKLSPPYDERFRGHTHMDREVQVAAMGWGPKRSTMFIVFDAWLVRRAHRPSLLPTVVAANGSHGAHGPIHGSGGHAYHRKPAWEDLSEAVTWQGKSTTAITAYLDSMDGLSMRLLGESGVIRSGNYTPSVGDSAANCRETLAWWQEKRA